MASDAFFPFPDCVEIAHKEGIDTVIQPGGSVRDNLTIDYCNKNGSRDGYSPVSATLNIKTGHRSGIGYFTE